jgi:two-component system OmpR family response regulator
VTRTILVVDDDPHIRDVLRFAIAKAGMTVDEAEHGQEALDRVAVHVPDLVVLDINMPRMDGIEVCRRLLAAHDMPILFLSSRDDEIDRILGLELGADDYVTKPFSPREVVARINAILKRGRDRPVPPAGNLLRHGLLAMDMEGWQASWDGKPVALTATEFQALAALARHPSKVFTRDQMMDAAYRPGFVVSDRTIDSHLRNIRAKFAGVGAVNLIDTVHGVGYRLGSCAV